MKYKEFGVSYKDEGNGSIEGYASTWIRKPDCVGDVVRKGAFTNSLANRWNGGKSIPFIWHHRMAELSAYIGIADAEEDEKGLHFVAKFDDTPEAQRVRQLYKDGRLRKFSIAYDTIDEGGVVLESGIKANELRELDLFEISAVCVPANDDAGVVDIKAGKRNSSQDEGTIRDAIKLLQNLLGEHEEAGQNNEEDGAEANAAAEEQKQRNLLKKELLEYIETITEV